MPPTRISTITRIKYLLIFGINKVYNYSSQGMATAPIRGGHVTPSHFPAERVGFEPTVQFYPDNSLARSRFRPLSHLSVSSYEPTNTKLTHKQRLIKALTQLGLYANIVHR